MRLLMIGAPGSGKGTQATRVAAHYGIEHISSGDLLREHVTAHTGIGQTVAGYLNRGDLVPDEIVMDVLRGPVAEAGGRGGYILDGFPRTVDQARAAHAVAEPLGLAIRIAVYLRVPRPDLVRRLLGRGAKSGRTDDTAAVAEHRLQVFDDLTAPLLDYYAERATVVTVDGAEPIDSVTQAIITGIDGADTHPDR
ncbi:adenylate kinase [Allocatelliglobosispora scoriae]|uniref:Adenylate kinase n=1 Tax=Allocatelliglobosispora scoriae TaxID=643052 RepID=A0A841BIJ5_9ACTN|nr:adenylate kinase [Allocatelliglobosispora scoriae]MBB5866883.1 adenylate kinase [Allocatelliglobosispora scoriae]